MDHKDCIDDSATPSGTLTFALFPQKRPASSCQLLAETIHSLGPSPDDEI